MTLHSDDETLKPCSVSPWVEEGQSQMHPAEMFKEAAVHCS